MKIVYEASNSIQAYILRGLLETYEIKALVQGEHLHSGAGELPMSGFIRIAVDDADFEAARKIIMQWEAHAPLDDDAFALDVNTSPPD